ncbi:MAG: hypothetical protein JWP42_5373 [Pseudomonas sp.]|nr:hypothetical protein [Pseudomonas sp.]
MNTYSASPTKTDSSIRICAPGNVRAWRNSPTTAVLSWDEPYATCDLCPNAIGYEVSGEGIATGRVTRPPYEVTGLNPDAEYLLFVTAKAAGNNVSTPSPVRVFNYRLVVPGKPGVPTLSQLTSSSVKLIWSPSSDNSGDVRYRVYLNGFLIGQVDRPEFNLMHLRSSVKYHVDVVAVNAAGLSEPATVTFKTALRAPTNLKLRHNAGTCRLSWDPMFLQSPTHEVTINGKSFSAGPLGFNFSLAKLSPGPVPHHFAFEVYARLDGAISQPTHWETTLYDVEPPTRPGKPVAKNIDDSSVNLVWPAAIDNTGVTGYRVFRNGYHLATTKDTSHRFEEIRIGSHQCVYVQAEDKDGNLSIPSERTLFRMTGPADDFYPAPVAFITPETSTTARLDWSYPDLTFLPLGVMITKDGEHVETIRSVAITSTILRNLTPGFVHVIEVFGFNAFGFFSEPTILSIEARDLVPPGKPGNLRVSDTRSDSFTLSWDAPNDDVEVLDYVLYNNHEYFDRTPLNRYTAVDLLPGTYSFAVCALDFSGNASVPASIIVDIEGHPSSPPRNFRFKAGLIPTLEWDAPEGMDDVIRYFIDLTGPEGSYLSYESRKNVLRPILLPNTRYRVSIKALGVTGRSPPLLDEFTT